MKLDKHGLNLNGLREAAGASKEIKDGYIGAVSYEPSTGNVRLTVLPAGTWLQYAGDVIVCGYSAKPLTKQKIADMIRDKLEYRKQQNRFWMEQLNNQSKGE